MRHPKHRASKRLSIKRLSIAPGSDPRATESQESWGDGGQRNSRFKSPHSSHMAVDLTYGQNSPPTSSFVNSSEVVHTSSMHPQIKEVWNIPRQGCLHLATQLPGAGSLSGLQIHPFLCTRPSTQPSGQAHCPSLFCPLPHCAVPPHALLEPRHHWGVRDLTAKQGV